MTRLLLSIGCNDYTSPVWKPLKRAEQDARTIYDLLSDPRWGEYDLSKSLLLTSPTIAEIRQGLQNILFQHDSIDVFTIFFAGHGVVKDSSYYLCVKDSFPEILSMTAFSTADLFKAINEAKPKQSNVIIDACESGGIIHDIGNLIKPEILGHSNTPAITIFSASASDQNATETTAGGISTAELACYIKGDKIVQTIRPYLDLTEIGRAASSDVQKTRTQIPNVWGLNLHGQALFTKNPHFTGEAVNFSFALAKTTAQSEVGQLIQKHATPLWNIYAELPKQLDVEKLYNALDSICGELAGEENYASAFITGITPSFISEAAKSDDIFAPARIIALCITVLLGCCDKEHGANATIGMLLEQLIAENRLAFSKLNDVSLNNPYGLLSERGGLSDLFYLPLRISKILGWLGAHIIIADLFGALTSTDKELACQICEKIFDKYSPSIVAISDTQSPYALLFLGSCQVLALNQYAELFLGLMFNSFVEMEGKIAGAHLEPKKVLNYLLCKSAGNFDEFYSLLANPSNLLSVLLLGAKAYNAEDALDPYMEKIDHQSFNLFVPKDYRQFGAETIREGMNFTFSVGREIYTVEDFIGAYRERIQPEMDKDSSLNDLNIRSAVMLSSMILPDRVFWPAIRR